MGKAELLRRRRPFTADPLRDLWNMGDICPVTELFYGRYGLGEGQSMPLGLVNQFPQSLNSGTQRES